MAELKLMSVEQDDGDLLIRIPIDLLVYSQENRPDSLVLYNEEEMVEYFKKNFLTFNYGATREDGLSDFEALLDDFFYDALESGELWIDTDDSWDE